MNKEEILIRAARVANVKRSELVEAGQYHGYLGVYNMGMEHMYNYLTNSKKRGHFVLLENCENQGLYCSECNKKFTQFNDEKLRNETHFCSNCGVEMNNNLQIL